MKMPDELSKRVFTTADERWEAIVRHCAKVCKDVEDQMKPPVAYGASRCIHAILTEFEIGS